MSKRPVEGRQTIRTLRQATLDKASGIQSVYVLGAYGNIPRDSPRIHQYTLGHIPKRHLVFRYKCLLLGIQGCYPLSPLEWEVVFDP